MKITYDPDVDVLYILLGFEDARDDNVDIDSSREIAADLDSKGRLVGIEIVGAKEKFGSEHVTTVTLQVLEPEAEGEAGAAE